MNENNDTHYALLLGEEAFNLVNARLCEVSDSMPESKVNVKRDHSRFMYWDNFTIDYISVVERELVRIPKKTKSKALAYITYANDGIHQCNVSNKTGKLLTSDFESLLDKYEGERKCV